MHALLGQSVMLGCFRLADLMLRRAQLRLVRKIIPAYGKQEPRISVAGVDGSRSDLPAQIGLAAIML